MSHSAIHTHTHTPAVAELPCNAPACHLEQLWVQCLAQGHLGMWSHVRWLKDQENKSQVVIRDGLWRAWRRRRRSYHLNVHRKDLPGAKKRETWSRTKASWPRTDTTCAPWPNKGQCITRKHKSQWTQTIQSCASERRGSRVTCWPPKVKGLRSRCRA